MAYATYMGAHVKRKEDPRLITGSGSYVGDLKLPGIHYVAFVRSPYAHARVGEIDASAALALEGVVAVVTGQDLAAHTEPMPFPFEVGSADGEANSARTHHALTTGKVLHMGECVAAVIAADAATAADAAEEVFVDWEPLPPSPASSRPLTPMPRSSSTTWTATSRKCGAAKSATSMPPSPPPTRSSASISPASVSPPCPWKAAASSPRPTRPRRG